jgi:hypothetical protein
MRLKFNILRKEELRKNNTIVSLYVLDVLARTKDLKNCLNFRFQQARKRWRRLKLEKSSRVLFSVDRIGPNGASCGPLGKNRRASSRVGR